ncbi:MAG: TIM barrel protein [Novosphingobium sp.]
MNLALHQVSVMDVSPLTLVDLAADVGCDGICVFTHTPMLPSEDGKIDLGFPLVTREMVPALKQRLNERNVSIGNVEFFPVTEDFNLDDYRAGLQIGQDIGAARLVTHIHDPQFDRAAGNLHALGAAAAEYGLLACLEFTPLFPACPSIGEAVRIINASGSDNVRIGVDALHLERSGGTVADVAAVDPALIGYCQICDGPRGRGEGYFDEALDRLVAGTGEFPLRELARVLPAHTAYDVETPLAALADRGVSATERVKLAVDGARWMLAEGQA